MAYVTTEDRVDRLEALFGQFMTEMALLNKQAKERDAAAEERHRAAEERQREAEERQRAAAEERHRAAEERQREAEERMARFEREMLEFKNEMRVFKDEMREFKDEMRVFKDEMRASKRAIDKQWGDLANKMGTIVEDILAPNLRRLARDHFRFDPILAFMTRCTRRQPARPELESEFDAVIVGPDAVILGEAKSTPTLSAAEEFAGKVATFFDFFPEYQGRRLLPVLGSWAIPEAVVARLTQHRIYAMQMGEDTMELVNAPALEAGR